GRLSRLRQHQRVSLSDGDESSSVGYLAAGAPGMNEEDGDHRQYAPATLRNRDFILDVLRDALPTRGVILEVASGSGEHVVHFAKSFPSLVFQPSDLDADARLSVAAWAKGLRRFHLRAAIALDASNR